ncbi:OLC1v1005556C1 [Oldenlandia corymbosa var. corymbosa]|uniref:OLC1v1005556C1 n=1 Tax=Oldenlandia corymbosa var. corymbosa TaxID=529605 RepID=A0AAV1DIB4_OLDCO|nr:OLC1v1005556C1 [Oldenlandia corymbosa var. corymbosa]
MSYRHAMDEDSLNGMSLQGSEFSEEEHDFNPKTEVHPQFVQTSYERSLRLPLNDYNTSLSRKNFKLSLLGYFIDDRSFTDGDMQVYMVENWPMYTRILHYDRNFFIIKFASRADLLLALDNEPYAVDGGLLVLRRMYDHEDLVLDNIQIDKISVWVRMHGAAITSYNYRGPRDLVKNLGDIALIKEDCVNLRKATYILVKVWINPGKPLTPTFHYTKRNGKLGKIHCKMVSILRNWMPPLPDAMYPAMFPEDDDNDDDDDDSQDDQGHDDNDNHDDDGHNGHGGGDNPGGHNHANGDPEASHRDNWGGGDFDPLNSIRLNYGEMLANGSIDTSRRAAPTAQEMLSDNSDIASTESIQSYDTLANPNFVPVVDVFNDLSPLFVGDVPVSPNSVFDVFLSDSKSVISFNETENMSESVNAVGGDVISHSSDSSSFLRSLMYYLALEENNVMPFCDAMASEAIFSTPAKNFPEATWSIKRKGGWTMSAPELEYESESESQEKVNSYRMKVRKVVLDSEVELAPVKKDKKKKQNSRRKSQEPRSAHKQGRAEFWSQLNANLSSFNYPIVLLGDFNQVVSQKDKCGGRLVRDQDTVPVHQFLTQNDLEELKHIGCWNTWTNKRQNEEAIYERMDRGFVNKQWLSVLPVASTRNLPIMVSDRAPILVQIKNKK